MSNYSFFVFGSIADPWALISTTHNPVAFEGLADLGSPIRALLGLPESWPALGGSKGSFKVMRKHISHPSQSADINGGRMNHRRQLKQRRRLVDAAYLGGTWRRRPEKKSWDWRGSSSGQPTAVKDPQKRSSNSSAVTGPAQSSRYYQESINLNEDSILSDDLLEALSRPLAGRPIRPRHAFASNRLTSRPAYYNQAQHRGRVRKISVR